jgi:hypothetical protein
MALHETIPQITHVVGFLVNIQMHETIPKHSTYVDQSHKPSCMGESEVCNRANKKERNKN